MHERHAGAFCEIEFAGQAGGAEQREDRHSVHVVGDGFAVGDAEAAPAFAFGGFEAFEEVEEGEGGVWVGGDGGEGGEDWGVGRVS